MNETLQLTERLVLRAPELRDACAFFEIHGDPQTNLYNPAGPDPSLEYSLSRLHDWLAHWRTHGFGYWTVATQPDPETIIGFGGLRYRQIAGLTRLNLYFRLRPAAWGQGYANEIGHAALTLGFDCLKQPQVWATVRPENLPSIHAIERLGLRHNSDEFDEYGRNQLYFRDRPTSQK